MLPVFKTDVRAQVTRMQEAYFEDPNPHHLFLLVLVKHGLATPYDMLSKLGLGVGATSPPLKRLEKAGLLTGTSQPRRSTRYAITEKGEEELRSQIESGRMRHWWIEESYVYRSTPRAMFLSWLYSGPKQISDCVDVAMQELRFLAHKKKQEAQAIRETIPRFEANCRHSGLADDEGLLVAAVYQWLKAESDAALFTVQIEALKTMGLLLANLPSAPKQKSTAV